MVEMVEMVERSDGVDGGESYKRDMREFQELFSKLNPMAEEFVPPSLTKQGGANGGFNGFGVAGNGPVNGYGNENGGFRRKKSFGQGKRRTNARTSMAQREDAIRRTVYVSDLDQQVTEWQHAGLFVSCGQVYRLRLLGDYQHSTRIAFVEYLAGVFDIKSVRTLKVFAVCADYSNDDDKRKRTIKERLGITNGNLRSYPVLGGRLYFDVPEVTNSIAENTLLKFTQ